MNSKSQTPYELRAELLKRAIDLVTYQTDANYQYALENFNNVARLIEYSNQLKDEGFVEAKKQLEMAKDGYKSIMSAALEMAESMNAFVSKN